MNYRYLDKQKTLHIGPWPAVGLADARTRRDGARKQVTSGSLPIAQITPHETLAVLRKVEATGRYESARRMRSVLSRVFRYGVATVRCDKDVAADLRGAIATPKVRHFAAITNPSDVGKLLAAIDGYTGHAVTRMAMRLSPHVFAASWRTQAGRVEYGGLPCRLCATALFAGTSRRKRLRE